MKKINIDLKVPTSWNELSPEQIRFVGWLYSININRITMLSIAFLKFTGLRALPESRFRRMRTFRHFWNPKKFTIKPDFFRELCESLSFITDEIGVMPSPVFKSLKAPDKQLFNISLDKYLTADFYYQSITKENKMEQISKMVETLYDATPKMSVAEATAVYLWYTGVKKWLREEYPYIFRPAESERISPRETVLNLLSIFNDNKPQNNELILRTSMHEIFFELNKLIMNKNRKS
jgi:hypothetical protein